MFLTQLAFSPIAPKARRAFPLLFSCTLPLGCGALARESAQAAVPAGVEASVEEVHEPSNRDMIADILADEEIKRATSELASAAAGGAIDALAEEERARRLADFSQAFATQFAAKLGREWDSELGPPSMRSVGAMLERSVGTVVDSSLESMMAPQTEARLGAIARSVGREAALGFQDAVRQSQARAEGADSDSSVLATTGEAADAAETALEFWPWVLAAVAVIVGAALGWFISRFRAPPRGSVASAARSRD